VAIAMSSGRSVEPSEEGRLVVPVQTTSTSARADAFERIYQAHYRDVYRYLLALTRSSADAEDVASETFERAYNAWQAVPDPALPWLLLTARRIATDRWRRARRYAAITLRIAPHSTSDAGEGQTEFWLWFDAVSRLLTDRQREVLVLRYQRDLTDTDIAGIIGISESGVRSLAARALDALRSHPELL
jgi:RNA polymerase sigma-70 factor (ECF subfamily)